MNLTLTSGLRRSVTEAALVAGLAVAALGAQHGSQSQVHNLGLSSHATPSSVTWNATPSSVTRTAAPAIASWN